MLAFEQLLSMVLNLNCRHINAQVYILKKKLKKTFSYALVFKSFKIHKEKVSISTKRAHNT